MHNKEIIIPYFTDDTIHHLLLTYAFCRPVADNQQSAETTFVLVNGNPVRFLETVTFATAGFQHGIPIIMLTG